MTEVDEDELVIIVPTGHPWAKSPPSAEELSRGAWVLREAGSGTRAMFEAALPGLGLVADDLTVALELPSNEAICAAVASGAGATAISRLVAANAIAAGRLATVALPLPKRRFLALRHKERYRTRAADALTEAWQTATSALLDECNSSGHWVGELSTSALSTATAVMCGLANAISCASVTARGQWGHVGVVKTWMVVG